MHFGDNTWININSDLISEYSSIYDTYEIDDEMIEYALDKNERAHMEYNRRTKTLVVIYNVLNLSKEENHYETIPLTFIVRQNQIVTISNSQNEYIIDAIVEELEENLHWNVFNLLLHSLFVISEHYFPVIEKLNKEQQNISKLLRKKTTKNNLFALSDLEIGGMYLVSATKQNAVVLEQLKTQQAFKEFDDFDDHSRYCDRIFWNERSNSFDGTTIWMGHYSLHHCTWLDGCTKSDSKANERLKKSNFPDLRKLLFCYFIRFAFSVLAKWSFATLRKVSIPLCFRIFAAI